MTQPFLGQVTILSFGFPPRGWALCNGQLLPINQNQALFSLIGTTYGGDGDTTFGLPNLQGCSPLHVGTGFALGALGGEQTHTLRVNEIPSHTHLVNVSSAGANASSTAGAIEAAAVTTNFAAPGTAAALDPNAFANSGGNQPHDNMSPYLVVSFVIAVQGIFPSRN
jgi:microcystin-dependent protein